MQGIEIVDHNLHIAVTSNRAVVERVELIKVSEAVDSRTTAATCRRIILHHTVIVGIVGRVILYAYTVESTRPVLHRQPVEC